MKRFFAFMLVTAVLLSANIYVKAADIMPFDLDCKSAVLMEGRTGKILYSKNATKPLPPASVTKVMTLLLIMEHIDSKKMSLSDSISVSEYAASMGGSQVFLESGETMSAEDMLKSIVIASANDAAVAMAEAVCTTEEAFVKRMNERAKELGMKGSTFENVTGLDDDTVNHTFCALDVATASRELITKHKKILDYSGIWMDTIRNGEFGLTNTNRLVRFYKGATGLKTGSTQKAGFCISATAERDGMELIAVIMGSPTRDVRNNEAKKLLDYGFSNFSLYECEEAEGESVKVVMGETGKVATVIKGFECVAEKNTAENVEIKVTYEDKINAPVKKGDVVGRAEFYSGEKKLGTGDVVAAESVEELGYKSIILRLLRAIFLK